jgi:acetyl-CoA C-acetyltransferase
LHQAGYQLQDVTRCEVDDYSLIHEVLAVEAIGLAEPGKGLDYLTTQPFPTVNVSGGGFCGYPLVCGGLCRLAEVFRQIADMAADQRVLIHEAHGIAAQGHAVVLLER